jgi:hypothetical protein
MQVGQVVMVVVCVCVCVLVVVVHGIMVSHAGQRWIQMQIEVVCGVVWVRVECV